MNTALWPDALASSQATREQITFRFPFLRWIALVLFFGALFGQQIAAQTPDLILLYKAAGLQQTNATTTEPYEPGYAIEIVFAAPVSSSTQVQLIGMGKILTLPRVTSQVYFLSNYFASEAALESALPDGVYTVSVSGSGTTPVSVTKRSVEHTTLITNFDALQAWTDSTLKVNWQPIVGATTDDLLNLEIERKDGTVLYSSPDPGESGALDARASSISIDALSVAPGETVYGAMTYVNLDVSFTNGGQTLVASGRGFFLRFPITRPAPVRPVITWQPREQSVVAGGTVAFSVGANGTGLTYQWRRNGVPIPGATNSSYIITNAQSSVAGFYTADITNTAGSVTSQSVALSIAAPSNDVSQIVNLAIRSQAGAGDNTLIVGFGISGGSGTVAKPILMRGVGPTLGNYGVAGTLPDPKIELFGSSGKLSSNDDWSGAADVVSASTRVGAFALSAGGKDAALFNPAFATGGYTLQVSAGATSTVTNGVALAEIYDATPADTFTATTPRLTNVSARTQVGTGADILITGFVIRGSASKTVLIRAVGPTLGQFGVPGSLADPKLSVLTDSGSKIDENDNWGGSSTLSGIFNSVGAFSLPFSSKDAAVVVTLPPGGYTAQVSGVGDTSGVGLVEVYELP